MAEVINQINVEDEKHFGNIIRYGVCSKCGCDVSRSQYGGDEDCPQCGESLDWMKHERWN